MVATSLRIATRFRGPPASGNGGYVAGLLARELGSSGCVVTLKRPPPLEEELRLEHGPSQVSLFAGEHLIASAESTELEIHVPAPPTIEAAQEAESRFVGFHDHAFPGCFVCGPQRPAGDGLRIFPGRLNESSQRQVAAIWLPDPSLGDRSGLLQPEFVWSALDCPGYFAVQPISGPALLGRLGVILYKPAFATDRMIVTGWPIESSGRKHRVGTALHNQEGQLLAAATATWISINERPLDK